MATTEEPPATTEENPLLEGLRLRRTPEPCVAVIFGASGDLAHRKLLPALYALAYRSLLPDKFAILGCTRTEQSTAEWRADIEKSIKEFARDGFKQEVWDWLSSRMEYAPMEFSDDEAEDKRAQQRKRFEEERGTMGNRLYYLAVPPSAIGTIVGELGTRRSAKGWTRIIVEKPFGHDLASAKELNAQLSEHFAENEVFRIDHYLGKETVSNMLGLRFANGMFEPLWTI